MPYQTATNPSTGEKLVLVGDQWQPYTQSATGANGAKAYLVGDKWLTDTTAKSEIPAARKERGFFETIGAPIEAAAAGVISGGGNVMFGGQELLGKGLEKIGATTAGRALVEDAMRRRAESQATVAPFKQEFPLATGAGELGAEVLATAPVGGAIAAPLKAIPAAAPLAQAIRTGGFSTGRAMQAAPFGARAADLAARAAGGAITGGATSALINPAETESGALAGAATAIVAPPIVSALAKSAGFLKDAFSGRLVDVKAGKIAREVAGDRIAAIRAALQAAPEDLTAAQATSGVNKSAWQALGDFAAKSDDISAALKQQFDGELAQLQRMAEGGNATEARAAYEQSIKRLNQLTQDMRNVELQAANQAAQTMNQLAPRLQQRQASMINALREGAPAPVPIQPTERTIASLYGPVPGENLVSGYAPGVALPGQATVHAGTEAAQRAAAGQAQAERIVPNQIPAVSARQAARTQMAAAQQWQETSDIFADIAKQRRAEAGFLERQIGSLADHGLQPLDASAITGAIDAKLSQPGLRASSNMTKVLSALKDDINNLTAKGGGVIDANDLYTLRKEGINERIVQILGQTDPKVSAKVTRKVLGEVRPLIDDAIEQAGGTGWRDYLKTYSQGMQAIDQKAMAAQAAKLFKDSPQEYVRLVRGNNPDAVEAIFGPGSYDIFKEMGNKMPTLEKLAAGIERTGEMAAAATRGKEAFTEAAERVGRTFPHLPNLLSRKATFANLTFAELEDRLGAKVATKLREGMQSGKTALDMLNELPNAERSKVLRALIDRTTWGQKGAAAARAVTLPTNALAPETENRNALAK